MKVDSTDLMSVGAMEVRMAEQKAAEMVQLLADSKAGWLVA